MTVNVWSSNAASQIHDIYHIGYFLNITNLNNYKILLNKTINDIESLLLKLKYMFNGII